MVLRGWTAAGLLALTTAVTGTLLWWTEAGLRPELEGRLRAELAREARLASAALGAGVFSDAAADRLGSLSGRRVTLIRPDGTVAGDSDVSEDALRAVENHGDRPEVAAALQGEPGSARRASRTVARELAYVALPHPSGVIRLAAPVEEVEAAVGRSRRLAFGAGLLVLLLGAGVVLLLGRFELPRQQRLRHAVRAVAEGVPDVRTGIRSGDPTGRLAAAVDEMAAAVAERTARLTAEKTDLDAIFERLEDGVAVLDPQGRVARANRAFRSWVGRQEVAGERFANLVRDPQIVGAVERALGGESAGHEATLGERTLLLSAQPHAGGALLALRDLTRLRQLEGVRRDFVANVSHELKTPLTGVIGFAEAVAEGNLPAAQAAEFGRRILANAERMRLLLEDLLDLARIEAGGWQPRAERLDVAEVATEVWSSLQPRPERCGVELAAEGARHPVLADAEALRQILRNLFDNALRYAPRGSGVEVATRATGERVRMEVSDRGPGIPAAHRERVFERFYRADAARSREAGGTGLGLSIVKHLVLAHGGEVGLQSELSRGTTVWLTLPAAE